MSAIVHEIRKSTRGKCLTDDAEVFCQTVSDKHAPSVDKESQLLVRRLCSHKRMYRLVCIQVSRCGRQISVVLVSHTAASRLTSNSRKLGQIIDDWLLDLDIIVYEG